MRILFCGGGTAGHVMPEIAMCEMAIKNIRDTQVAFVGRQNGNENKTIVNSGYKLYTIDIQGLSRSLSLKNIAAIFKLIRSKSDSVKIIREFNPDLIIGTGGYVCFPIIRQGQKMGIPTIIHESNAYPGLVTRMLGSGCTSVLLNFEGACKNLKRKDNVKVVGNPLRMDFKNVTREAARKAIGISDKEVLIVSFGGSLGAEVINNTIIAMMYKFSTHDNRIRHIHATGQSHYNEIEKAHPRLSKGLNGCRIVSYIENMPILMRAADIAITRSGAMTLSELAYAKTPSILIPSPNVVANHQYENAKFACEVGGAVMIEECELNTDTLITHVRALLEDPERRKEMSVNLSKLAKVDTEKKIIDAIKSAIM